MSTLTEAAEAPLARSALEVNCDGCGHRTVVGALSFWGCVAFCERCEPWELDAYDRVSRARPRTFRIGISDVIVALAVPED